MDLVPLTIKRVIASTGEEFAIVLEAPDKTFLIFVGQAEAFAIYRELKGTPTRRPLSHDLLANILQGFDIRVAKVAISSIVESTFCATLLLVQDADPEATGPARRRELRLDLRASDAMIVALKAKHPLFATRDVVDQVEDVSELLDQSEEGEADFES